MVQWGRWGGGGGGQGVVHRGQRVTAPAAMVQRGRRGLIHTLLVLLVSAACQSSVGATW
jgi:hypothetical protein